MKNSRKSFYFLLFLLFLISQFLFLVSFVLASVSDLRTEYPLIKKTLDPPGVCTFYNPNYCSPFTQEKFDMGVPLLDYIQYEDMRSTTLAELVDRAEKDLVPEYYVSGLAGDNGFFNKEHYDPDAPGWFGTCHKWCAWQSSKDAVKISSEDEGYICGKYYLGKGEISEYFTAVYPATTVDKDNIQHFYGGRTNPYYYPKDDKDPRDVKRASAVNLLLMDVLDKMGYSNFWPHEADQAYNKYIVEDERAVTTNVDAHSPSVWNQPTFHFERYLNTDIGEDLPLLSITDQKYNYYGPTLFYEGTPNAISDLKKIEDIDYALLLTYIALKNTDDLRADGKDKLTPILMKDEKIMKSLDPEIFEFIKNFEDSNRHYYMDVVAALHQKKISAFERAKPYLKFKDGISGIFVRAKVKYLQECKFRAAVNFVREAFYDYYILKDEASNTTLSMWANSKLVEKTQPDFIAASVCVDDECKEIVENQDKVKEVSSKTTEEKIKDAEYVYWMATGTFFKLLDKCVKVKDVKSSLRTHIKSVESFNKDIDVDHASKLSKDTKESLQKKYLELREGPNVSNNYIQFKKVFNLIPRHIGGVIVDSEKGLVFADFEKRSGTCFGDNGKVYDLRYCLVNEDSSLFYSTNNKKCEEYRVGRMNRKKEFLREVPLTTCALFGAKPHRAGPTPPTPAPEPTPSPVVTPTPGPTPIVTPTPASARDAIMNDIKEWQKRSLGNIDRNVLRVEAKKLVMKLAYYDVFKGSPVRYPNLMPFGVQNTKVKAIWMHLDQKVYKWAVRKFEAGKKLRYMMTQNYSAKDIEKLAKPIFKELAETNMKLQLKENKDFALQPNTVRYPAGQAGDMWKYLNEKYYKTKWSKTKFVYYSQSGF